MVVYEKDLMKNKRGKIVSKRRHNLAKRRKTLMKLGYKTEKGVFKSLQKKLKVVDQKFVLLLWSLDMAHQKKWIVQLHN